MMYTMPTMKVIPMSEPSTIKMILLEDLASFFCSCFSSLFVSTSPFFEDDTASLALLDALLGRGGPVRGLKLWTGPSSLFIVVFILPRVIVLIIVFIIVFTLVFTIVFVVLIMVFIVVFIVVFILVFIVVFFFFPLVTVVFLMVHITFTLLMLLMMVFIVVSFFFLVTVVFLMVPATFALLMLHMMVFFFLFCAYMMDHMMDLLLIASNVSALFASVSMTEILLLLPMSVCPHRTPPILHRDPRCFSMLPCKLLGWWSMWGHARPAWWSFMRPI